jgi:glycosyltransferase involved in cell wall biosynthesis
MTKGRLRVLMNLSYLRPGHVGGSEVLTRRMLAGLAASDRVELEVVVLEHEIAASLQERCGEIAAPDSERVQYTVLQSRLARALRGPGRLLVENSALVSHIRRALPDVVLSPANFGPLRRIGAPHVVFVHDLQHRLALTSLSRRHSLQRDFLIRRTVQKAQLVLVPASHTAEAIDAAYSPSAAIVVLPEGVGELAPLDKAELERIKQRLGIGKDPYFIYPAMHEPHKNHRVLIEAMAHPASERLQIVLPGRPTATTRLLRRLCVEHGVGSRAVFPGYLDRLDLMSILQGAAGLVYPSLYEGFGLPLLEAMAARVPVLCSDRPPFAEVCDGAAIVVAANDGSAWARAMQDVVLQRPNGLVRAGVMRAAELSWDSFTAQLITQLEMSSQAISFSSRAA